MEKPVTFVNRSGSRLFGMLYEPDVRAMPRVGILISVNAVKYRVGTFRLHVLLARKLCALGYSVLTFDPQGIGDSEGQFEYKLLSEHYYDIQTGKYDSDLKDAIEFFLQAASIQSLLVLGLCGGAISVLMQAAGDSRVASMILLNIPVLMEDLKRQGQENHAAKITSSGTAGKLLKGKLHRIVEVNFWLRFLRLQVDIAEEGRLVSKALLVLMRSPGQKLRGLVAPRRQALDASIPVSSNRLFNMHFQRAFMRSMAEKKRLLFIFAELDAWTSIFRSEFQDLALKRGNPYKPYYDIETIHAANHIFSGAESQRRLEQAIVSWLEKHHPLALADDVAASAGPTMASIV